MSRSEREPQIKNQSRIEPIVISQRLLAGKTRVLRSRVARICVARIGVARTENITDSSDDRIAATWESDPGGGQGASF